MRYRRDALFALSASSSGKGGQIVDGTFNDSDGTYHKGNRIDKVAQVQNSALIAFVVNCSESCTFMSREITYCSR